VADDQEFWYSARCVFRLRTSESQPTYEERIVLLRATSEDDAMRDAEADAVEYAAVVEGCTYTGYVDSFHLFETHVGHRAEVFSLMRSSELAHPVCHRRYYGQGFSESLSLTPSVRRLPLSHWFAHYNLLNSRFTALRSNFSGSNFPPIQSFMSRWLSCFGSLIAARKSA